jgi:ABC-type multidrug transport system permease subunit
LKKKLLVFFSNDTSILKVKKKTNETQKNENSDGISIGIIIFIIILCIILIGFIGFFYYFFYYKKKYLNLEKKFIKYSKFDDENVHGLEDYENIY